MDVFGFTLFAQLLESVGVTKLGISSAITSSNIFSALSLLWDSQCKNVRPFVIVPKVPFVLFFFFLFPFFPSVGQIRSFLLICLQIH